MSINFWKKLKKPFFCLAPMSDVTDAAFRRVIAKYGKPDAMWTEFVSADGMAHDGLDAILKDLRFTQKERPIVAQLFTANPDNMQKAARIIQGLGFDGLDINMGCPDRKVEKQGAGAGLMKDPDLAKKLILAAKKGAPKLPISVKTRIGYTKNEIDTWIPILLKQDIAALTIHWRTRKDMSRVPAKWHLAKDVIQMRNEIAPKTLIIGNGDIDSLDDARHKADETGVDGVMIGRGIFGNPWFFKETVSDTFPPVSDTFFGRKKTTPDTVSALQKDNKLRVLIEHAKLYERLIKHKSFAVMKKHFKAYVNGWDGAKQLRMKLMQAENAEDVEEIIKKYLK